MNPCSEKCQEDIVEKNTQEVVVQIFNKSKSKLLNYGYFTIFAPLKRVGSRESGVRSLSKLFFLVITCKATSNNASNPDGGY